MEKGNTNAAVPAQAVQMGASDGVNLKPIKVDASGNVLTSQAVEGVPGGAAPAKADVVGVLDSGGLVRFIRTGDADGLAGTNFLEVVLAAINAGGNADRLRLDSFDNLQVSLRSSAGAEPALGQPGDGTLNTYNKLFVASHLFGYNGVTNDQIRVVNVSKSAYNAAVANAANLTVWTPAAGKKFRLMSVVLSSSVTGRVTLIDNALTVAELLVTANSPVTIQLPTNGYLSAAVNNVLSVQNNTGGPAGVAVWVTGCEE